MWGLTEEGPLNVTFLLELDRETSASAECVLIMLRGLEDVGKQNIIMRVYQAYS